MQRDLLAHVNRPTNLAMRKELLKHTWSGMVGTATTTERTGAIATRTLGAMEAQRRAVVAAEEVAGIWATGFVCVFFCLVFLLVSGLESLGAKPANACKGRTSSTALLRPKLN